MKIKKLLIILGCCIITLYSLVFVGCKRETTLASSVTSDSPLIELPTIPLYTIDENTTYVNAGYIPSLYLGELNGQFIFYYASIGGSLANLDYGVATVLPVDTAVTFSPKYVSLNSGNNIEIRDLFLSGGATITISNTSYDYLFQNCAYIGFEFVNNTITYYFFNSTRNNIGNVTIRNIYVRDNVAYADYDYFIFTTLSSSANATELVNRAYSQGYDLGYNQGYTQGVNDGAEIDFNLFDTLASSVNSLLDIKLFGDFSISTLLYISFGLIMIGIVIKVFMGG